MHSGPTLALVQLAAERNFEHAADVPGGFGVRVSLAELTRVAPHHPLREDLHAALHLDHPLREDLHAGLLRAWGCVQVS